MPKTWLLINMHGKKEKTPYYVCWLWHDERCSWDWRFNVFAQFFLFSFFGNDSNKRKCDFLSRKFLAGNLLHYRVSAHACNAFNITLHLNIVVCVCAMEESTYEICYYSIFVQKQNENGMHAILTAFWFRMCICKFFFFGIKRNQNGQKRIQESHRGSGKSAK